MIYLIHIMKNVLHSMQMEMHNVVTLISRIFHLWIYGECNQCDFTGKNLSSSDNEFGC